MSAERGLSALQEVRPALYGQATVNMRVFFVCISRCARFVPVFVPQLMAEFSRCADRVLSASDTTPVETKGMFDPPGCMLDGACTRSSMENPHASRAPHRPTSERGKDIAAGVFNPEKPDQRRGSVVPRRSGARW